MSVYREGIESVYHRVMFKPLTRWSPIISTSKHPQQKQQINKQKNPHCSKHIVVKTSFWHMENLWLIWR